MVNSSGIRPATTQPSSVGSLPDVEVLPNVIVWQGIADFDQPDSGGAQDEGAFAGDEYRFGLNKRQGYFGLVASAVFFHMADCATAM